MCVGALAHPITSSELYLHLFTKALGCLTDMTRSARCDIRSASQWLNICYCRCLPLGAGCCSRVLGCSLLGCLGATDDCTVGGVGACCTASTVERVVMGYPATSTLGYMSGLTASG